MKTAVLSPPTVAPSEVIINNETRTFDDNNFSVGDVVAQGDLYMVRIDELPASAKPRSNRQLADGSTQGSRHVLTEGAAFDVPVEEAAALIKKYAKVDIGTQYVGPIFQTTGGRAYLEHPEHGDHAYKGSMTCAVIFQRTLDAEEREARVRD